MLGSTLQSIGRRLVRFLTLLGEMTRLARHTLRVAIAKKLPFNDLMEQLLAVGVRSFPLVATISVFTGMVLSLQFIVGLTRFGLQIYTGQIVGVSIARELGPVLTALMVAARAGSGITAELGSMAITEQILAVEAMGADPVYKLMVPRVLATTIATPLLTVLGNFLGVLGGMVIATSETGVGSRFFLTQILQSVEMYDFGSGIGKSFFFGFFIGIISCFFGMRTQGGGTGVGKATTLAVVVASITIFVSDFFLTKLFILF